MSALFQESAACLFEKPAQAALAHALNTGIQLLLYLPKILLHQRKLRLIPKRCRRMKYSGQPDSFPLQKSSMLSRNPIIRTYNPLRSNSSKTYNHLRAQKDRFVFQIRYTRFLLFLLGISIVRRMTFHNIRKIDFLSLHTNLA